MKLYIIIYINKPTHIYVSMCKIHTNSQQACIISERKKTKAYSAQLTCSLILNFDWSENFDQATALLQSGQSWSHGPNFDHFAQSEWLP